MNDNGWQQFINHIAQQQDLRQRKQDMPGTILCAVLAGLLVITVFCIILKSAGWL